MPTSAHYTQAAFFQETTSGTGPANAAAWVASGVRTAPLRGSFDPSGIGQEIVPDERARERINDSLPGQQGIDNPEFTIGYEFEISGSTVADTSAIAQTQQMQLLAHCMGGIQLGTSTTASGTHSTTTVEIDATTGADEGTYVAVQLSAYTAAPTACHVRRITDLTGSVATVDQAFPNAPVDTDPVHAVAQVYVLESDLIDSSANDTTLSWLAQRGPTGGTQNWEIVGSKAQLDTITLERGALAKFALTVFGGSSTDPDTAPSPAWTSEPTFENGVIIGPDTQLFIEDYGTTTNTIIPCSSFSITPGLPVSRDETVTTTAAGLEGTACYTTRPEDMLIELSTTWTADHWADFNSGTLKTIRLSTLRPAGQNIAFSFSRVEIVKVETLENGDALHVKLMCKALEDTLDTDAANEDLHRSRMSVLYY